MTFPSPRPASKQPPAHAPNAALLIDFDNVTMGIRSDLQVELRKLMDSDIIRGKVAVQRAYADWRRYPQYIVPLSEASIDLIFAPAFGSNKKNATDIRLAIDAVELVFTRPEIGTIILLSGDSDFSSLVIKLKEYGKYIIGVGIRESASDLLIQNCDEYYSYNELAGLARAGEDEGPRRDPWDLVVDAVLEMKKRGDVMRSDRLKQVMQELDSSFDEKNVGMSRFSKFVDEAKRRGLLTATKLENGQYEIDLGSSAPGGEGALPPIPGGADERRGQERAARDRERGSGAPERPRRGGRGRGGRDRGPEPHAPAVEAAPAAGTAGAAPLSLAEAFELLKRVLREMGAFEPTVVGEDAVRERMEELHGNAADPLFHRPRFGRLLRQAHDAEIVNLSKNEQGYEVTLRGEHAAAPEPTDKAEPRGGRRGGRGSGGGRGRGGRAPAPKPEAETAAAAEARPAPATPAVAAPAPGVPVRGIRYRGHRSGHPPLPPGGVPLVGVVEIEEEKGEKAAKSKAAPRRRSRGGSARRAAGRSRGKKGPEEPSPET